MDFNCSRYAWFFWRSASLRSVRRYGVKVVVSQRDEAESLAAQLHDLFHYCVGWSLAWLLSVSRHTEQNEQCLGQPRTVCTEAHI